MHECSAVRGIISLLLASNSLASGVLPGDILVGLPGQGLRAITLGATYTPTSGPLVTDLRDALAERSGQAALLIARPSPPSFALVRARFTGSHMVVSSGGLLNGLFGPSAMCEAASGEIFVAVVDSIPNTRIVRIDPVTGAQLAISSGGSLFDPRGMAVEPSGRLLVANGVSGSVLRISPHTGGQTAFVPTGSLQSALDVVVTPAGGVFALDGAGRRVVRVHPVTGALTTISEGGLLRAPVSLAVGPTGHLYVGDLLVGQAGQPLHAGVIRVRVSDGAQVVIASFPSIQAPPQISFVPPPADPCPADINADGRVDFLDLGWVLSDYGAVCPPPPEP